MNDLLSYYADMVPLLMSILALVMVLVEWIALTVINKIENHKEGWVNIFSAALTFLPVFLLNAVVTILLMYWLYSHRLFDLGLKWYAWILAYVAYDFMSYAVHWLSHKVRFLWCIHSVHHSPKEMKASVAFRGSFADFLVTPHIILWLPIFGFHPCMVIIVEGFAMMYGVLLHLNEHSLPEKEPRWLNWFFITPSAHRLHHAKNDLYLDTNYGLTFRIWDSIFSTYQKKSKQTQPVYGIRKEIDPANLLESQTDEFIALWKDLKNAPGFLNKAKYLFMPPGWNHLDGGTTASQIRKRVLGEGEA